MIKKYSDRINKYVLDNGLKVTFFDMPGVHSFSANLIVHVGALYEKYKIGDEIHNIPRGVCHFIEHKMFDMPNGNITKEFDKYGIEVNAFTSFLETRYVFYGLDHFMEGLNTLIDFVFTPYFIDDLVESERKVIINEALMYQDDPMNKFYQEFMNGMFYSSPFGRDIGGSVEDITKIKTKDLIDNYNIFYHPKNMDLVIIGSINKEETINFLNEKFKNFKFNEYLNPIPYIDEEPVSVKEKNIFINTNIEVPSFYYGIKLPKKDYNPIKLKYYYSYILNQMFGFDTKFSQKLINKRIINYDLSYGFEGYPYYPFISISGDTFVPEMVIKEINKRIKNFSFSKLKKKELERSKKMWIGSFIIKNDSIKSLTTRMIDSIEHKYELDDVISTIENMNLKEAFYYFLLLKQASTCYGVMKRA